jgi:mannose-6-phosphate isomerase-like protein (cupin superfamily)
MSDHIEQIEHEGQLLAIIVRNEHSTPGVTFFTSNEAPFQLAYMHHLPGTVIPAHVHNPMPRQLSRTSEALLIRRGRMRVHFFDGQRRHLQANDLAAGDVLLLLAGGHGFEILEELEMIEVKQGPYAGEHDKTVFASERLQRIA